MAIKHPYREVVGAASRVAGLSGVPGAFSFGADLILVGGVWAAMIIELGARSGRKIDKDFAFKVVTGVLTGIATYVGGSKIAMKLLHLIPGAGSIAAMGVNSVMNYLFTYKIGNIMSSLFDKEGYDFTDANNLITTSLALVTIVPTIDEIADMTDLATGPVNSELFTSFKKPELFKAFEEVHKS